jgi:hypothetical protein
VTPLHTTQRTPLRGSLRAILLENPAVIEHLPAGDAASTDRLIEMNGLEPSVCERATKHGVESLISPQRLASWRTARLMASARASAYAEALTELVQLAAEQGFPVRLLPSAHMAFRVHPSPELRPLASLDVQVPPGRERELQAALKTRRFFEADDLVSIDYGDHHHLRPLVREGVTVKLHRRSALNLRPAPWDAFPERVDDLKQPLTLAPEPLVLLLCHEMAQRRFSHSLGLLCDLRTASRRLKPDTRSLVRLAAETGLALEAFASFLILEDVLGPVASRVCLRGLEMQTSLTPPRRKAIAKAGRASMLQYPASPRLIETVGKLLDGAKVAAPVEVVEEAISRR